MSNEITDDCSSGLHDYCTPCQCECHTRCNEIEPHTGAKCELQIGHKENHKGTFPQGISQWPHGDCECKILDRKENESQREWLKRCMCMHHWMQTQYYRNNLNTIWLGTEGA